MKVLITGGAGYIGSHCNKVFAENGVDAFIVDDLTFGHREAVNWGKLIEEDFSSDKVLNILKSEKIDAIIHFAASADVEDSVKNPNRYYENNVTKFIKLLDMMVSANVRYIIFSSSAAIFGEPEYIPIDESHPQKPINPYGTTKLIDEYILKDYERCFGIKFASLRYFNASGADPSCEIGESHNPEHHLIPIMLSVALRKRDKLQIFGNDYNTKDGTPIRDFIHVTDLAEVHYLALKYVIENNRSILLNLGSNEGYSVKEIVEIAEKVIGKKINWEYANRRAGDPATLVASNKLAIETLNWKPKFSNIETIIKTAWDWENNRKY